MNELDQLMLQITKGNPLQKHADIITAKGNPVEFFWPIDIKLTRKAREFEADNLDEEPNPYIDWHIPAAEKKELEEFDRDS